MTDRKALELLRSQLWSSYTVCLQKQEEHTAMFGTIWDILGNDIMASYIDVTEEMKGGE